MRSTFNILFYVNKSKEKNGVVPVMGRVTINGTQSQFSCKKSIPLDMWDVKGITASWEPRRSIRPCKDYTILRSSISESACESSCISRHISACRN